MNKANVTIVVEDKLIVVDGDALRVDFSLPENVHEGLQVIQWHNEKGDAECFQNGVPHNHLFGADKYDEYVKPFVDLWEAQKSLMVVEDSEPSPEEIKQKHIRQINRELYNIDMQSIRPERCIQLGKGTDFDTQKLLKLETQAELLRGELMELMKI